MENGERDETRSKLKGWRCGGEKRDAGGVWESYVGVMNVEETRICFSCLHRFLTSFWDHRAFLGFIFWARELERIPVAIFFGLYEIQTVRF